MPEAAKYHQLTYITELTDICKYELIFDQFIKQDYVHILVKDTTSNL